MERKKLNAKKIQQAAAATVTEKAKNITIRVRRVTWRHRLGLLPKKRVFKIKPIVAGNLMRVSSLLLNLNLKPESKDFWAESLKIMANNIDDVVNICAIAMHGAKGEPPEELVGFLNDNADIETLSGILIMVSVSLNTKLFMSSITLINRMSLLKDGS